MSTATMEPITAEEIEGTLAPAGMTTEEKAPVTSPQDATGTAPLDTRAHDADPLAWDVRFVLSRGAHAKCDSAPDAIRIDHEARVITLRYGPDRLAAAARGLRLPRGFAEKGSSELAEQGRLMGPFLDRVTHALTGTHDRKRRQVRVHHGRMHVRVQGFDRDRIRTSVDMLRQVAEYVTGVPD